MKTNNKDTGFTLIELLVVVAIIAIVASIAIPNMMRARLSANEVNAIASLRALVEAQSNFRDNSGVRRYATMAELAAAAPPYIDPVMGGGQLKGYTITIIIAPTSDVWGAAAVPNSPGSTGVRGFYADEMGLIRFTTDGSVPTPTDPPLQ